MLHCSKRVSCAPYAPLLAMLQVQLPCGSCPASCARFKPLRGSLRPEPAIRWLPTCRLAATNFWWTLRGSLLEGSCAAGITACNSAVSHRVFRTLAFPWLLATAPDVVPLRGTPSYQQRQGDSRKRAFAGAWIRTKPLGGRCFFYVMRGIRGQRIYGRPAALFARLWVGLGLNQSRLMTAKAPLLPSQARNFSPLVAPPARPLASVTVRFLAVVCLVIRKAKLMIAINCRTERLDHRAICPRIW